MKLPITLKEKHFCFVGDHLSSMGINLWGKVVSDIIAAISGEGLTPESNVSIEIEETQLASLYYGLGEKREREASLRNEEMKGLLLAQLIALTSNPTYAASAQKLLDDFGVMQQANLAAIEAKEEAFRQWAKQ